jgi:hypothetical protein
MVSLQWLKEFAGIQFEVASQVRWLPNERVAGNGMQSIVLE